MLLLKVSHLSLTVADKPVLNKINLTLKPGEIQALVGPNGSGKSSLLAALVGQPDYTVTSGRIIFRKNNLLKLSMSDRAKAGLFMAWQNPVAIPGLNVEEFLIKILRLHASANHQNISLTQARQEIFDLARQIGSMDILKRDLNDGLSGGEKKRLEVIQMAAVKPKLALVDEIDSGLDAGSLLKVSKLIRQLNKNGTAFLIVSHHFNLLRKVKVDQVNFLAAGRLVKQTRLASLRQLK